MEIDISCVLYKWRRLTYEVREWEKVMCLLGKAGEAQPPVISHAFLKDNTAKTFTCKIGFSSQRRPRV